MTDETLAPTDAVSTEESAEVIEPSEQPIETEISADELTTLREQAEELKEIQAQLAAEKRKEEILQRAAAEEIKGMDKIYDFLDPSFLTDEKLPEIFAAVNAHLHPRQLPIGITMNRGSGQPQERSTTFLLAEAAEKARTSGRIEDLTAYSKLRRTLKK
ncbi:hypothetical protein DCE79_11065 [Lysinibacillus sp. 2017]|uniref:hypothetical protein n=1 Tax=unclassified Lysinibacillus TaxID=2636778 RepID=UPI000D525F7B|nr:MULTISPECIES: hypothetical protein [unclassified Lysinibacillus]AWE07892.1 hypothetical protein DCE79_11065 [Lysinibacillus sp. 2017]TGN33160.1 hypothetical protein E4L99_15070 [Lysinibacillus sp. S2017]